MTKKYVLLTIFLPLLIFGKSYFYPQIKTEIYFTSDGSARIRQERTYQFDGSYSWAFVDIKKTGADNIILNQVAELTDTGWAVLQPEITDNQTSLYIKWNYSAQDESKTFLLDYTISGVVTRYQDVAEFYWKVIEDDHEKIGVNIVELFLPDASPDLFKVYVHSRAKPGELIFNDIKNNAAIQQDNIPENSFVEVRMLTSPSIFASVEALPENQYEKILKQEKQNFIVSSIKKFVLIPLGLLIVIVCPIVLLIIFYSQYGKEPQIPYTAIYEHEPPRKVPPIVVPAILSQKPEKTTINQTTFRGMFAVLLDLCTQGIVSVQEVKEGHKTNYQFMIEKPDKIKELEPINQKVVKFLFEEVSNSSVVLTDKDLKNFAAKHSTSFQIYLQDLFQQTREWWEKILGLPLLDQASSSAYNRYLLYILPSTIIGEIMFGIGLTALFGVPGPVSIVIPAMSGIFIFIIFMFLGRSILRWSAPAYLEQKRWLNFRKFLTDMSAIKQAPITLLPIWEHYFVYAVVLGVAQKFLKNLTALALEQNAALVMPVWYVAASGTKSITSFADSMSHFESFASNFNSMMNSFSTSAATGGGFSGGGGGGGGGGSSGAG